jgi:hypothetical protein
VFLRGLWLLSLLPLRLGVLSALRVGDFDAKLEVRSRP